MALSGRRASPPTSLVLDLYSDIPPTTLVRLRDAFARSVRSRGGCGALIARLSTARCQSGLAASVWCTLRCASASLDAGPNAADF